LAQHPLKVKYTPKFFPIGGELNTPKAFGHIPPYIPPFGENSPPLKDTPIFLN